MLIFLFWFVVYGERRVNDCMKVQEEYTRLFHYCLYRLGIHEDAEDAVQETFLRYCSTPNTTCPVERENACTLLPGTYAPI